jgi:hypothetical protein
LVNFATREYNYSSTAQNRGEQDREDLAQAGRDKIWLQDGYRLLQEDFVKQASMSVGNANVRLVQAFGEHVTDGDLYKSR